MNRKSLLLISLLFIGSFSAVKAQFCPTNVDFESGLLPNWNYFRGQVNTGPVFTFSATAPVVGLHTLMTSTTPADPYGGFPVLAPGGGSYSLKLGHDTSNQNADRALYWVHVPPGVTNYSLIYHYAAVLNDPGTSHATNQKPQLMAEAFDSVTGVDLFCDSFVYLIASTVPGFINSGFTAPDGTPILYKPWTTGNFRFNGANNRTVGIRFTAGGCSLGGHFGYGYVDMSCGLFAISTVVCGALSVTLSAPDGYAAYKWVDSATYSIVYGTTQVTSTATPSGPTTYAVILTPYMGYGCPDTLYTHLTPTSMTISPSADTAICIGGSASLTVGAADVPAGMPFTYSWAPATGLTCTNCANPIATPTVSTAYTVTAVNAAGCPLTHVYHVTVYPYAGAITGTRTVCSGETTLLSDPVAGGIWTSTSPGIASIGSTTGLVTGGSPITTPTVATIYYGFGSTGICGVSTTVTVNPLPAPIAGPSSVCVGQCTGPLTDATAGGTWSSSLTTIATIGSSSGLVCGVGLGTATLTYKLTSTGCFVTRPETVVPNPSPISGPSAICQGQNALYTDAGGGTWSSSNMFIATIGSSTGLAGGVAPGVDTLTYTLGSGCTVTKVITVNAAPSAISGPSSVCQGSSITLADGTPGGFWTSSNNLVATVEFATGVVWGVVITGSTSPLLDTITYTAPGGCTAIKVITVNPLPLPISIMTSSTVCSGDSITLIDIGGGRWSPTTGTIATVGSSSGIVYGVTTSGGSITITYTLPTGCFTTIPISVAPMPPGITGPGHVCVGGTITLHDILPGGAWSTSNGNASVTGAGDVSGIFAGTVNIIYTTFPSGCKVSTTVTVDPLPIAITGATNLCAGTTSLLTGVPAGGTWSPATGGVATVSSGGVLTGVATGSVPITYTSALGCPLTTTAVVYPLPSVITGPTGHVCSGASITLSGGPAGGTWSSTNLSIATITPSGTSVSVHGASPGLDTIKYTNGTGCFRSFVVTVNSTPGPINGNIPICAGSSITLTDTTLGGSWSISSTAVATIGSLTGLLTGAAVTSFSTATVTYSLGGTCVATAIVSINPSPAPIAGTLSVCAGQCGTTLTCTSGGGTWSSSNTSVVTITPGPGPGTPCGVSAGVATITYTLPTGCFRIVGYTVNALPAAITGASALCIGRTDTLHDATTGGTWSPSTGPIATVNASGVVTGVGGGTTTITYKISATGCYTTTQVTVNPLPAAFLVTGTGNICPSDTGRDVCIGGSTPGIVYTVYNGATPVGSTPGTGSSMCWGPFLAGTYTVVGLNPVTGCSRTMTGFATISVAADPNPIGGASALCVAANVTETDPVPGGTWSPAVGPVVNINPSTGVVTGVAVGTATITYTTGASCKAFKTLTVSPSPGPIIAPPGVCVAACTTLGNSVPGGIWSTCNPSIATINTTTGLVCGVTNGTVCISYSLGSTGCTRVTTITVTPAPSLILGGGNICAGGTITLSDATPGGIWNSIPSGVLPLSPTTGTTTTGTGGMVTISTVDTVTYTVGGCSRSTFVTVNPGPSPITGPTQVCAGQQITMMDTPYVSGTGIWSCTPGASIDPGTGVLTGGLVGTATVVTVTYTLPTGCSRTRNVTVNPLPTITTTTSGLNVCSNATITLHGTPLTGGVWSSGNLAIASVGSVSGIVVPGVAGVDTITYFVPATGCSVKGTITVNPVPAPIGGNTSVCVTNCTFLSDGVAGGTWSSGSMGIATVGVFSGMACGASVGTANITYTLSTGCFVTITMNVTPPPDPITGPASVCQGQSVTMHDATSGGTWYTINPDVATIEPGTGILWGVSSGTVVVSYSVGTTGCSRIAPVIVNPLAPIEGDHVVCVGQCITLLDTIAGGTWTSSSSAIATTGGLSPTTGTVCGVSTGAVTITYTTTTGCRAFHGVTVNPAPPPITGPSQVCSGESIIEFNPIAGTWDISPVTPAATIDSVTGVLTAGYVAFPTPVTVHFHSTAFGCDRTRVITVNPLPNAIGGPIQVCVGSTVTLTETSTGGTWASTPGSIATITSGGVLSGVNPGSATVSYVLPTGCGTTSIIDVNPLPDTITGSRILCVGQTTNLFDATPGGTWSSSDASHAPVDISTGVVVGLGAGTYTITYTAPTTCIVTTTVTVSPIPTWTSPPTPICEGQIRVMSALPGGGKWSSSATGIATIDSVSGVLIASSPGSTVITYAIGGGVSGCSATTILVVNASPDPITGSPAICLHNTTILSDLTPGGTWSSTPSATATVDVTGVVTGLAIGGATVSYTVGGCFRTLNVSVNPAPGPIMGVPQMCEGDSTLLSDSSGGVWSSTYSFIASVNSAGMVYGVSAGSTDITFSSGAGCSVTKNVTVNAVPQPITGATQVCANSPTPLFDVTPGGAWSSADTSIAVIDSSTGVFRGVNPGGVVNIYYTTGLGCFAVASETVNPMPAAISGNPNICIGSTRTYLSTAGGTWTSSATFYVTIDSTSGVATGHALGSSVISYELPGGCKAGKAVNVVPLPGIYNVTGGGNYCAGGAGVHIGLSNSVTGVDYYLYLGATPTGMFPGTGAPLDFGLQTVGGSYTVIAVSTSTTCSNIMSGSALVTVMPIVTPHVSIGSTPADTVCAGTSITVLATPGTGSGTAPTYQWSVNGVNVDTSNSYTFVPADGDMIVVAMTSNATCAVPTLGKDTLRMTVNPFTTPTVGINADPSDKVCRGTYVNLTAVPTYGGTAPAYTWIKNGFPAASGPVYSLTPADGDSVRCIMVSSYPCALTGTVSSAELYMNIDTPMVPIVTIDASPGTTVGNGQFDTLTANVVNGGFYPAFQWFRNGYPITGATTNTYITNTYDQHKEDSMSCMVTSDAMCPVTSHMWVYINASAVRVQTVMAEGEIIVVPNPNKGEFTIKGTLSSVTDQEVSFELTNMLGQVVYKKTVVARDGRINEKVAVDRNTVANGMYMLNLHSDTDNKIFHVVIEQ